MFGCLGPKGEGNCWYCYAKATAKWASRKRKPHCGLCDEFKPHPHLENLESKTTIQRLRSKTPKVVFVDGHFDWNGVDVKKEWLEAILAKMREYPQHAYPILSKRPELYDQYGLSYPKNVMLGTTVTNEGEYTLPEMAKPWGAKIDLTLHDWMRIEELRRYRGYRKAVSFEPLLGLLPKDASLKGMDWVVIGPLSAHRKLIQPKREWVSDIVDRSRKLDIPIFMKNTLTDFKRLIQKYPPHI